MQPLSLSAWRHRYHKGYSLVYSTSSRCVFCTLWSVVFPTLLRTNWWIWISVRHMMLLHPPLLPNLLTGGAILACKYPKKCVGSGCNQVDINYICMRFEGNRSSVGLDREPDCTRLCFSLCPLETLKLPSVLCCPVAGVFLEDRI